MSWETKKERRSGEVEPESNMAWEKTKECRSGEVEKGRWLYLDDIIPDEIILG